jgi:hypothetical protein
VVVFDDPSHLVARIVSVEAADQIQGVPSIASETPPLVTTPASTTRAARGGRPQARAISGRPAARWFRRPPRGLGDRLLAWITAAINNLDVADLELAACQIECLNAHRPRRAP